jgi:hypothetical protein
MLNSSEEIKFVKVIAPAVNINALGNKQYAILDGPSENTFQQQISTSFSNNTINIEANPPNGMTYINRYTPVEVTFEITFTGTSAGVGIPLLQAPFLTHAPGVLVGAGAYDCPRSYPLMNATNSLQLKIGDATISQNINQFYRNFNHYYNFNQNRTGYESTTPNQLDPSWSYSNTFGTVQSPMNGPYDCPDGTECPRGGYVDALVVRNDATGTPADVAVVRMTVREPILISPWLADGKDAFNSVDFIGIQTFNLIFNLGGRGVGPTAGLVGALWSHNPDSPSTISGGSVNVLNAKLLSNYKTPDPTQILNSQAGFTYSYFEPQLYPTTVQNPLNPGDSTTIVMNNIQLGSVPNLLYISVQESDQFFNFTKTDTFYVIENINITFDNRSSLLATMSPIDLFNMSKKNGSVQSWRQFSKDQGSIICIMFGSDLALGSTLTAGVVGNFSLNMKVTFRNQTNAVVPSYTLNAVVIQEGVMTISENRCYRTIGPISRSDVLASKNGPVAPYHHPTNFYGGNFLDKLKKLFGRLAPVLRTGLNVAQRVAPEFAPQFVPGLQLASDALKLTGNGLVGGRRRGRKVRGGEMMSKADLYELM